MSTKATKKVSASTETFVGSAAQSLKKSLAEYVNATAAIDKMADRADELSTIVASKEAAIEELDVKYQEKERQLALDLDLRMKERTELVVNRYLNEQSKTAISTSELSALKQELETTKTNFNKDVQSAVAAATSNIKGTYESDKRLLEAEHRAAQAKNEAQIETLEGKVVFLEDQVEMWKSQLNSERQASIERSRNAQQPTINVTGTK
jgi:hypothetical protein